MPELFEDTLRKGYHTWRGNIKIGTAPLANVLVKGLISLMFVIVLGALLYVFIPELQGEPVLIFISVAALLVTLLLIDSFFVAGAVGMAKEATEKGNAGLNNVIVYGRGKVSTVFLAKMAVAAVVYILPISLIILLVFASASANMLNVSASLGIFFLGAFLLYSFLLDIVFYPVSYAIVVEDLGVVSGLREGCRFTLENRLVVILMWVSVGAVGSVFYMTVNTISSLFNIFNILPYFGVFISVSISLIIFFISMIISAFLIEGLAVTLWTRLYIERDK